MITPENIIDLIKETHNVDITVKGRQEVKTNLKTMYFYLCVKYCNSVLYGYKEIGGAVKVKHPNVTNMCQNCCDRLNVRGWEDFTNTLKNLEYIIKETYSDDDDYLDEIKLDSYDTLMLKKKVKEQNKRNTQKNYIINNLINKVKKLEKIKDLELVGVEILS